MGGHAADGTAVSVVACVLATCAAVAGLAACCVVGRTVYPFSAPKDEVQAVSAFCSVAEEESLCPFFADVEVRSLLAVLAEKEKVIADLAAAKSLPASVVGT